MVYKVIRSREANRDLELIFDHLSQAYLALGDNVSEALALAEQRLRGIQEDMRALGRAPYQGTLSEEVAPGLRHVTKNRTIFYFQVNDEAETVRVLAIFFGGQDHRRHVQARLRPGA